jgi:hypothetical protein
MKEKEFKEKTNFIPYTERKTCEWCKYHKVRKEYNDKTEYTHTCHHSDLDKPMSVEQDDVCDNYENWSEK